MGTGAPRRRVAHAQLLRTAFVFLISLAAFLAPAAGTPVAATTGAATSAGCAAPEVHEELRLGRPERERAQPVLPRSDRGAVEVRTAGAGGVAHAQTHLSRTQVEALPHPLERIPIRRT